MDEQEDITSYWRDAKRLSILPKHFYVIGGKVGGFHCLALHQVRCTGEVIRPEIAPFKPMWLGIKEAILWQGPLYYPRPSDIPGKVYSYSKRNCFLTKEAAVDQIHTLVAEYEHLTEMNLVQVGESIAKLEKSREHLKDHLLVLEGFSLSVKDLK